MRTSLSKHLNEFVLCRGWIGVWEDFPSTKTRRITVNQPTITKPNKRLLFKIMWIRRRRFFIRIYSRHRKYF